jgi:hypothetical protein
MIDLRKVVDKIHRDWGHNILLQRSVLHQGEGIFGLRANNGFSTTLEKYTVTNRFPAKAGLADVVQEQLEGKVASVDLIYYFRFSANPNKGDRIYEKDPNGYTTYIVDWALPMRGVRGRIEYWIVGASIENEEA